MQDLIPKLLAGAIIGAIALALDYFFLQHIFGTPVARAGGINVVVVLIYLIVPFLILLFGGKKDG
jgi:hypothetical protein